MLRETLKKEITLHALLECVLRAEVDAIATSLTYYYHMNGLDFELLAPVLERYFSSTGRLKVLWYARTHECACERVCVCVIVCVCWYLNVLGVGFLRVRVHVCARVHECE
jgi:hypothetical protein